MKANKFEAPQKDLILKRGADGKKLNQIKTIQIWQQISSKSKIGNIGDQSRSSAFGITY
jgi:hypothetical protein